MAQTARKAPQTKHPQIVDATQRRYFEQRRLMERVFASGTVSAAVMVLAAVGDGGVGKTHPHEETPHFFF